jgi:hypothetical protein
MGVTESRVYQMHTEAVLQLRAKTQDARELRTGPRAPAEAPAGDPGGLSTISGNGPHRQAPPDSVTDDRRRP